MKCKSKHFKRELKYLTSARFQRIYYLNKYEPKIISDERGLNQIYLF